MTVDASPRPRAAEGGGRRSLGLKFLLVCFLVLLLIVPAAFVEGLISERVNRARSVVDEVGATFGGRQMFTGPVLAAPWRAVRTAENDKGEPVERVVTGWYAVFPETGSADAEIAVDTRTRGQGGLFKVRTYEADIALKANFALPETLLSVPDAAVIDWSKATLLIGVADTRGAKAANIAIADGARITLAPGSAYADVFPGANWTDPGGFGASIQWLAAPAGGVAAPGRSFATEAALTFTGVESLSLGAFAKETKLRMRGDWGDVGYSGAFPSEPQGDAQTLTDSFDVRWSVPYVARGVAEAGDAGALVSFANLTVATKLIDAASPYQAVQRALKYAIVFIGVVFLAYFLMEATSLRRVHPAQYILVGLAQVIFYLLLLSIAERIGFDPAFAIAATATVGLIGAYAGATFKSLVHGAAATGAFAVLYALIYLLMRLEDYALLVGSVAAFLAIAAVMLFTRNLDWYGVAGGGGFPIRIGGGREDRDPQ